jgi:16S rRNA processing protein RimM
MRDQIDISKCAEIGFIKKPHGLQGEVFVSFEPGIDETLEQLEYVFVLIDGAPVPFFIEEITFRSDTSANVKLEFVDSQEKAKQISGCTIYTERKNIVDNDDGINFSLLKGVAVFDKSIGKIGTVQHIEDFGGNVVMTVDYLGREVLIPLNEELVVSFTPETNTLIMKCPKGILDMEG